MNVSLQDVREALGELGKFRFGEMRVEDALHEIVHTMHLTPCSAWTAPA